MAQLAHVTQVTQVPLILVHTHVATAQPKWRPCDMTQPKPPPPPPMAG